MPYIQPGAYAQFVKSAGAVNTVGASRIMAIIGTGTLMYNSYNEAVGRDENVATASVPYDTLANQNVFQVLNLTSKPSYNGVFPSGTTTWTEGKHFTVHNGQYIVWYTDPTKTAQAIVDASVSNVDFAAKVTVLVDGNSSFMVPNGKWRIEVTYVDATAGTYRVIDEATNDTLGEYAVSSTAVSVIPGVDLTVTSTFKDDGTGNSTITVGDFVMIDTTAAVVPDNYTDTTSATPTTTALPKPGDTYYVSYTYKKPDTGFEPQVFFDQDDVVAEYGNYEVTASGVVINSLTLGSEIAFTNGVSRIVCVQAKNNSDAEMMAAMDKLKKTIQGIENVNSVIPLTTSKVVGAHAMSHVIDMSSPFEAKERMTYLAAAPGETSSTVISTTQSYNNERVVYVVPGRAYKLIKNINTGNVNERLLDGSYLAVAVSALALSQDPAEPLTNKNIDGFTRLVDFYEESEMNSMAAAGALIIKQAGSTLKIRHGITTSVADVNSTEITLVQIKDYVIDACRTTLGQLYVGNKLRPTIVADIQSSLQSILNSMISQEILLGFNGVKVKVSPNDPREVDIFFQIEAVYPLNYIMIQFGFSQAQA